jgi:putative endonuclease
MNLRQNLGRYGEDRAAIYLQDRGYEIIDRNWRSRSGEIDLVARDRDRLVFVEVKTRNGSGYGHPFESITKDKVARMRRLVADWCQAKEVSGVKVRLDAISVLVSGGRVSIEHLKQVF